jgi:xylan 1,4-beta-xylosidase
LSKTLVLFLLIAGCGLAQNTVTIRVHASEAVGPFKPIYGYFGYDEPNYTYTENGSKLVGELAALSSSPVYIRTHFLLATGNGTPSLKFGSTNAYTEDAAGKPVYDWTVTDRIFDTYLKAGAKPFAEIGFMPEALSSKPHPYFGGEWVPGAANKGYYAGWSYPPNDYKKWGELVYQWVSHCVQKYGASQVSSWYWEVWNEPDISYWHGTPEEYDELYDFAADAVKRALPGARVGGPASTGPASAKAGAFLRQFLKHCASGKNYATGRQGAPLDFVTFHAKGQPKASGDHVQMGIAKNARDVDTGIQILSEFSAFRDLPVVLSESDPEGCAACSARVYPQNAYRNGPLYAAYEAAMLKTVIDINDKRKANIAGMLTWAFEFENQPWFDGFRTLATNGVDKPVLNVFRMAGLMRGDRVRTESDSAVQLEDLLTKGVGGNPDVDAMAARSDGALTVLAWNYHDDDVRSPAAEVRFEMQGIPAGVRRVLLHHYRIDETHSNSWTAWKNMGSPQHPTAEQIRKLEDAGQLQLLESPRWLDSRSGSAVVETALPRQGVSLLELTWAR